MYTCRECERPINQATELCPYCGADLTAGAEPSGQETPKKRNLVIVLLRWGVLLGAIWAFLWYVLPESGDPRARAEQRALELLLETRTALVTYADAQGGGFPASLDALPRESAAGVRQAAQRALGEGYRIEYAAGSLNPAGHVTSFSLRARAGNFGYRNFFTDQTGVIRATRENRNATADDPPIPD